VQQSVDIIGIYDNQDFAAPIAYTLDLILSLYGVSYQVMLFDQFKSGKFDLDETLVVSYASKYLDSGAKRQIHIYASAFFDKDYLKPVSMPRTPLRKYNGLPVIYSGDAESIRWIKETTDVIETNIDIIASSFFMLSRYEEVLLHTKDKYSRFPATASLAYKEGFLDRPIVNEYIELLWGWIKNLNPKMTRKPFWPDSRDFAVCLTHDVDWIRKYSIVPPVFSIGSAIMRQKNLRLAFNITSDHLRTLFRYKKDPFCDTFDYMLDVEREYGFKSSFYFMAREKSWLGNRYSLSNPQAIALIRQIEKAGCEVGMHGGYDSYNRLEHMLSEKARLDAVVKVKSYGCRQHCLRWKTPDTWRLQEKAGLLYDATLSFADHVGFRCGICLPYQPFDIVENRKLAIWELPLIVQEVTLHSGSYQKLPPGIAYNEIVKHIEITKRFHGVFVLLWHNSSFDPLSGWSGWKKVYEDVMSYIGKQNAFIEPGRNIIKWWQANPL
jgi:peptidoglycan/xylan/chitin deacetylase (PgdA/CDA1 family)